MNRLAATAKRTVLPVLGLALTAVLAAQVLGLRNRSGALAALGLEKSAAAAPASLGAEPERVVAEGRLTTYPGGQVTVGTDFAGVLTRLLVDEKDTVRRGQLLAELRADDLRAEMAEARARVAEAEADLRFAEIDITRAERLLAEKVGTAEALDRSRRNRDAAAARRQTAEAAVSRLAAELAKTRLVSPIDGTVILRHVHPGEHVEAGEPILVVADLVRTRIEAEVDEFDAGRVALGADVTVSAEGFEGQTWKGKVEEIPDSVAGRRLKPQDPSRPSDTRVLLVKVALAEPTPLKLGQRVEVAIGGR